LAARLVPDAKIKKKQSKILLGANKGKKVNQMPANHFFGMYDCEGIDFDGEIQKLYNNAGDDMDNPPRIKFLPSRYMMKCLILRYVQSTLF